MKPLTVEEQFVLLNDSHPEIRYKLAQRKDTVEGVLRVLQLNENRIKKAVEHHPFIKNIIRSLKSNSLNNDEQSKFAHHWNPLVRKMIASLGSTSIEVLESLVFDEDIRVRQTLALNPNTPEVTLKQLAKDHSLTVRMKLLARKNLSDEILAILCEDSSPKVLRELFFQFGHKLTLHNYKKNLNSSRLSDPKAIGVLALELLNH